MKDSIEIIVDNAGGMTIQDIADQSVAYFPNRNDESAIDSLRKILDGADLTGWDLSEPDHYIDDATYNKEADSGGLKLWDEDDALAFLDAQGA